MEIKRDAANLAVILHETHGIDKGVASYLARTFPLAAHRQLEYLRYAPIPRATRAEREQYGMVLRFRIENDAPAPMAYIEMREAKRIREHTNEAELRIRRHEEGGIDSLLERIKADIIENLAEPIRRLPDSSKVKAATIRAILKERLT